MRSNLYLVSLSLLLVACGTSHHRAPEVAPAYPATAGSAEFVRPTDAVPRSEQAQADRRQIEAAVRGVIEALNNDGKGLERYYLPDARAVFFGPPTAGPELQREIIVPQGGRSVVVQTGVVDGSQYVATLSSCLAAFRESQTPATVLANNDLEIRSSGPLAFATLTGANVVQGEANPWRWTLVLEKVHQPQGEHWAIVHDHLSFS